MKNERTKGLVSVVISNYNNEKFIIQGLDSIVNQSYKNIELIIVDDASTDDSVKLIKEWISKNSDQIMITLIELPRNCGFSGALTTGLYVATGQYIAMQDGDDYSHVKRIERQVNYLESNIDVGSIGCNYAVFSEEYKTPKTIPNNVRSGIEEIREIFSKGESAVCHGTLLFRGEIFDKIGGLNRNMDGAEDYDYITRLLPYGVDNLKQSLYYYRIHEKQRSKQFYGDIDKKREKVDKKEIRVLMVIDRFNIGGTETHVLTLAKGFIKQGIKVVILAEDGPLGEEFRKLNCRIYNMKFPFFVTRDNLTLQGYKSKIEQIINAEDINIIHCHQSPSGALAVDAGKELNIPTIFTIHGLYYDDIASSKLQESSEIISVSHPVYEWLLRYGVQSKVVPNGIVFDDFNEIVTSDIREELNIPKEAMVVMYCSRMAWGKIKVCENLMRVVRDLTRIEAIDIYAVIVGDGPGLEELQKVGDKVNKIVGKDIIKIVGGQLDMIKYYNACDCVVGTGRVAIEGMASKKPVIATGNNGYCGLLTQDNLVEEWRVYFGDHKSKRVNNATYLYEDLLNVYNNREEVNAIANETYEKSKELFDIDTIIDQIVNIYVDSFRRDN